MTYYGSLIKNTRLPQPYDIGTGVVWYSLNPLKYNLFSLWLSRDTGNIGHARHRMKSNTTQHKKIKR
jgi:hypothetical protein